ncbi:MAG: DUF4838 domain-containing protein, partial [Planctomycetota bacterium]
MRLGLALLLCLSVIKAPLAHDLQLVHQGRSQWIIVTAEHPAALEQAAAERLQNFMQQISGAKLPIKTETAAHHVGKRILVGNTLAAEQAHLFYPELGQDGFTIQFARKDLLVFGGSPQATDYAVTSLLEHFGCRMWAPDALYIPKNKNISLDSDFSLSEVPPTPWRSVHYAVAADAAYRRWHKLDWVAAEINQTRSPYWVHSVLSLVPPATYFEQHPAYFALVDGERRPSQLCLANPEVLQITKQRIHALLEEHPSIQSISVSQADNQEYCQCEQEQAQMAAEGSPMGPMLAFVNAVAREFPELTISTLAYQYTRKPPLHLRPEPNVSIMLCTLEEDRSQPIADNPNSTFAADFSRWSELCDKIFLWDYEVQFTNLLAPFPNFWVLQPNVQWFVSHPLHSLFLQGNGVHTEFSELRCYLLAKLAWNPNLDFEATMDEFLLGFYGLAAPDLRAYLDLMQQELQASGQPLRIFGAPAEARETWLRPAVLEQAEKLFAHAKIAVKGNPVWEQRLRFAHAPVLFARLECARARGALADGIWQPLENGKWEIVPGLEQTLDDFLTLATEAEQKVLREWGRSLEQYRAEWARLFDPSMPDHRAFRCAIVSTPSPV